MEHIIIIFIIFLCIQVLLYRSPLHADKYNTTTSIIPNTWNWDRISSYDANIWSKFFSKNIAHGCYVSFIFDQHMSRWCGCCYLVSVLQMIQDKMNIVLGLNNWKQEAKPFVRFDFQIALNAYNAYQEKNSKSPNWNACLGGNPVNVMKAIETDNLPLCFVDNKGFAWYGHPVDYTYTEGDVKLKKNKTPVLQNDIRVIQYEIFKYGPVVLSINSNCITDTNLNKRHGIIDTNVIGSRNHAITVIGWCKRMGNLCWIGRNTWGKNNKAPSSLVDKSCVQKSKNTCDMSHHLEWFKGGFIYIPFSYSVITSEPSPWFTADPEYLVI